jgi:quercetin dioxygenase-like cupin family protein
MMRTIVVGAVVATLLLAVRADAQTAPPQPIPTHVFLNRVSVSGVSDKAATMMAIEWPPDASTGERYHAGDEYGLVTEGALRITYRNGEPPQVVKAGEAYHIGAGAVYEARNVAASVTYSISTLILDRGAPLSSPAK